MFSLANTTRIFFLCLSLSACGKYDVSHISTKPIKPINDTGTNYCRHATAEQSHNDKSSSDPSKSCLTASRPQQDGHAGRDALARANKLKKIGGGYSGFDWTKLTEDGEALADQHATENAETAGDSTQAWSCVRDNHTGLVWEVKSNDDTQFNYTNLKYSWYNPDTTKNAGKPGRENTDDCNGIACNTQAYIQALNTMKLCGSDQWRLPTINEHLTLSINDFTDLAMDKTYFPHAKNDQYWSSQTFVPRRELAWYFYFSDGSAASALKTTPVYVRLVHQQ